MSGVLHASGAFAEVFSVSSIAVTFRDFFLRRLDLC